MPTKKRRLGFIPRSDVLSLINKLSYESNLSISKIINILVEESLHNRGLFNNLPRTSLSQKLFDNLGSKNQTKIDNVSDELKSNYKNKFYSDNNLIFKDVKDEPFDEEIYAKFLLFLQFKERIKKKF